VSALALIGLQLTPALPSAVGVYAVCFAFLGFALAASPDAVAVEAAGAQVQGA